MTRTLPLSASTRAAGLGIATLVAAVAFSAGPSPHAAAPADVERDAATTRQDQVDLAVTVYNSNLALVRDVRRVALPTGATTLRFEDIAASINPAAVHVRSLTAPATLDVLEQNYEYDLLDPQKLLQKYVGREVTLVRARQENGSTRYEEVTATLLALNNGPVWRVGGDIVTGLPSDHYRFPELPGNLFSQPTLLWHLRNTGPREHQLEVSYLTGGLGWSADYVLTVDRDDRTGGLDGWVTLTNTSGTTYREAKLQLVAGEIHRARNAEEQGAMLDKAMRVAAASEASFVRETFSEYHLYALGRRTSIREKETKQVSLLNVASFPVTKRFVVNGDYGYYRVQRPGAAMKDEVEVFYAFRNSAKDGLGQPLPSGIVRVYQADSKGALQFVGEDRIGHTPEEETLDLKVGNAFDIVCERKQTDYKELAPHLWEVAYEVRIRNHKKAPIDVEVNEPVGGDWEMVRASHPWTKTAAFAARFVVPVPAGAEAVVTYRVRIR